MNYANVSRSRYENCEGTQYFLSQNAAPAKWRSYYDPVYDDDKETNEAKATEWWHVMNCGRQILHYNA